MIIRCRHIFSTEPPEIRSIAVSRKAFLVMSALFIQFIAEVAEEGFVETLVLYTAGAVKGSLTGGPSCT
jgi:hypothetical protein